MMSNSETSIDRELLSVIQRSVPLVAHPYSRLANEWSVTPDQVMRRVAALRAAGVIREISGIFDAAALGYVQTLAAFAVPEDRLAWAGRTVAEHPGVSHCYGRGHEVNLWFTLALSPGSALGLEPTIHHLAAVCRAKRTLILPTLTRYKLHVHFGEACGEGDARSTGVPPVSCMGVSPMQRQPLDRTSTSQLHASETAAPCVEHGRDAHATHGRDARATRLTEAQILAVRALQVDLPVQSDPFSPLAELADTSTEGLLQHAADLSRLGVLRRYAAVLHHRQVGGAVNVLVAWEADEAAVDAAGQACAALPQISHCYRRARASDWPFDLYTMIHGPTREHCLDTVQSVIALTGLHRRCELWTTAEFKKQRVKLLGPEERQWETA